MARKRNNKTRPFVKFDAQMIKRYMPIIGGEGLAVLTSLKLHENRQTGQCNPAYQTIADDTGYSRPTVIKYAQLLESLKLIKIFPIWTAYNKQSSNQYVFVDPSRIKNPDPEPIPPPEGYDQGGQGDLPPVDEKVNDVNPEGKRALPEPEVLNQISLTKEEKPETPAPTKQHTCTHPAEEVCHLDIDINICNHCFGLLDDTGRLVEEHSPVENAA